jgi:hypothetical protein
MADETVKVKKVRKAKVRAGYGGTGSGTLQGMPDGFPVKITLASLMGASLWNKDLKPVGLDGGEPIDTTTMYNSELHTYAPRILVKATAVDLNCTYLASSYSAILAQLNVNQEITITFPDESTLVFWGWLQKFEPSDMKEGDQPMAKVTIFPSFTDTSGAEVLPTWPT